MDYHILCRSCVQPSPKHISFSDGNIVLIAGHAAFKVHRGQLERHSDVFRDLFSVPQPVNEGLVDGCPSVKLYDHPTDLYHLLIALYDGVHFLDHAATNFAILSSVLRLSTKYFIEHLRECCLTRLARDCPASLTEWDHREDYLVDNIHRYGPYKMYTHPILILDLALELNLDDFLPGVLYNLARLAPSRILASTHSLAPIFSIDDEPQSQIVRLSEKHLYHILMGREYAQQYIHNFLDTVLLNRPLPLCLNMGTSDEVHCLESFYYIHLNVLRSIGGVAIGAGVAIGREADPLHTLLQAAELLDRTDLTDGKRTCGLRLCTACKIDFRETIFKARLEVWELIPEWFGLRELKSAEDIE